MTGILVLLQYAREDGDGGSGEKEEDEDEEDADDGKDGEDDEHCAHTSGCYVEEETDVRRPFSSCTPLVYR